MATIEKPEGVTVASAGSECSWVALMSSDGVSMSREANVLAGAGDVVVEMPALPFGAAAPAVAAAVGTTAGCVLFGSTWFWGFEEQAARPKVSAPMMTIGQLRLDMIGQRRGNRIREGRSDISQS